MKEKSKTVSLFKKFHAMVENQFHNNIQVVKSNNARDYFSGIFLKSIHTISPLRVLFTKALAKTLHNKMEW